MEILISIKKWMKRVNSKFYHAKLEKLFTSLLNVKTYIHSSILQVRYCPFNKQDVVCDCCEDRIAVFEDVVTQIMIDEFGIHIFVKNCAVDGILNQNIFLDKISAKNTLNDCWKNAKARM